MNLDTRIKFRHLLCFLEIARQGSFAKAADAVAISQPAISKTLKELEDLLQTRLFERDKSGVELTAAGVRFMRYAGPCVQALRDEGDDLPLTLGQDVHRRRGEVGPDRPLAFVNAASEAAADKAAAALRAASTVTDEPPAAASVIHERIT